MALLAPTRPGLFFRWPGALLLVLWLGVAVQPAPAQEREYQIKAAFLYNFLQFVKWPPAAFSSADAPLKIGILGDDPFGSALDETVQGEAINGHRVMIERSSQIEDLRDCQMIFICRSEQDHIDEILAEIDSRPVLTVSEVEGFARKGGDIDFYLSGEKVRFAINPQSARQCGLQISSQLLSLGRIEGP